VDLLAQKRDPGSTRGKTPGTATPLAAVPRVAAVADRRLPPYFVGMKFSIGYFAKPRAPGIPPAPLASYTGDFNTVDDARKAAIADADNPKIGAADSITIEPIGERWVKGETLIKTSSGWERRREPE
jgi:hypothetical protein